MNKTVTKRVFKAIDKEGNVLFTDDSAKGLASKLGTTESVIRKYSNNPGRYYRSTYSTGKGIPEFRIEYTKWIEKIPERVYSPEEIERIKDLPNEQWKPLPGYAGNFVSNLGRVKFVKKGKEILAHTRKSKNGTGRLYYDVSILEGKKIYSYRLHRVIARAWLDETLGLSYKTDKRIIDHIDNNSENNNIDNIRIVTYSENISAFWREQNHDNKVKPCVALKKCYVRDITDNSITEYPSTTLAGESVFGKDIKCPAMRFGVAVREKTLVRKRYMLGYDKDELANRSPDDHCKRVTTGAVGDFFRNNAKYIYTCNETNVSGTAAELGKLYGVNKECVILCANPNNCRKSCKGKDGTIYTFSRKLK